MTTITDQERALEQAKAQLEGIVELVKRLDHIRECDGEDCELTDAEIYAGISLSYIEGDKATEEERGQYHDEEEARQSIDEDPLSVQVRSDWHNPGEEKGETPAEYVILLCTGGPAVRITGELDQWQQPGSAKLQYQDWFTPWELYHTSEEEYKALITYAGQFYFGEG